MAVRLLALSLRTVANNGKRVIPMGAAGCHHQPSVVGNREVVGYGFNGQHNYTDRADYPMPAVRFREVTPDILVSICYYNTQFKQRTFFNSSCV